MLSRVHPKLCLSDALGFYLWIQSDWQSKIIITLKYFLSFSCLSFNLVVSSSLRCYKYFMNSVLTSFSFMTSVFFGLCGTPYCPRLPVLCAKISVLLHLKITQPAAALPSLSHFFPEGTLPPPADSAQEPGETREKRGDLEKKTGEIPSSSRGGRQRSAIGVRPGSHLVIESTGETGVCSYPRATEGDKPLELPSRCLLSSMWILPRAGELDAPGLCAYLLCSS